MPGDGQIDYIELPGPDLPATKRFYAEVFGWVFTEYGPEYVGFKDRRESGREAGGFNSERKVMRGGPLVVLYAADLPAMARKVKTAGGEVLEQHEFPGGKRFHFRDPNGNELAVWSDK